MGCGDLAGDDGHGPGDGAKECGAGVGGQGDAHVPVQVPVVTGVELEAVEDASEGVADVDTRAAGSSSPSGAWISDFRAGRADMAFTFRVQGVWLHPSSAGWFARDPRLIAPATPALRVGACTQPSPRLRRVIAAQT